MNSYNGFSPKERLAAFKVTKAAWEDGTLPRPTQCEACGRTAPPILSHDEDYGRPLDYYTVCFVCHMMIHCRYRSPERWAEYLDLLDRGAIFEPVTSWPAFRGKFLRGQIVAQVCGSGPPRPVSFLHALPLVASERVPEGLPPPVRLAPQEFAC